MTLQIVARKNTNKDLDSFVQIKVPKKTMIKTTTITITTRERRRRSTVECVCVRALKTRIIVTSKIREQPKSHDTAFCGERSD